MRGAHILQTPTTTSQGSMTFFFPSWKAFDILFFVFFQVGARSQCIVEYFFLLSGAPCSFDFEVGNKRKRRRCRSFSLPRFFFFYLMSFSLFDYSSNFPSSLSSFSLTAQTQSRLISPATVLDNYRLLSFPFFKKIKHEILKRLPPASSEKISQSDGLGRVKH